MGHFFTLWPYAEGVEGGMRSDFGCQKSDVRCQKKEKYETLTSELSPQKSKLNLIYRFH